MLLAALVALGSTLLELRVALGSVLFALLDLRSSLGTAMLDARTERPDADGGASFLDDVLRRSWEHVRPGETGRCDHHHQAGCKHDECAMTPASPRAASSDGRRQGRVDARVEYRGKMRRHEVVDARQRPRGELLQDAFDVDGCGFVAHYTYNGWGEQMVTVTAVARQRDGVPAARRACATLGHGAS